MDYNNQFMDSDSNNELRIAGALDDYLPQVSFEAIPIEDLVPDPEYQRELSEKHVKKAAANFDIHQLNPVKVSRRNGKNYVVNGQHTMEIVATVSGSRKTKVWCMVYEDLCYQQEADIFANQQKYVKSLTPYDVFMANIEAGNSKQLLIKDILASYAIRVSSVPKSCCICGIKAVEHVYDQYGQEVLSRTLRLIVNAWEGNQQSLGATMIKGIAKLIDTYGIAIDDNIFIEKLGEVSVKEILRSGKERRGGSLGVAEAILAVYNRKSRNSLSIDSLYRKRKGKSHE